MIRHLALAMLALSLLPAGEAAARPAKERDRRAAEVRRLEERAEELTRAYPHTDPRSLRFYQGTPWTAAWVRQLCTQPASYGRPSAATCRAAAMAQEWGRR